MFRYITCCKFGIGVNHFIEDICNADKIIGIKIHCEPAANRVTAIWLPLRTGRNIFRQPQGGPSSFRAIHMSHFERQTMPLLSL
jgi:hypothetical protein